MRVSLLLLLFSAAGCFAKQPAPPEIVGKSMFVAVETDADTHEFWVVAREVEDGTKYPTILLDDEKRVDVYFFGCSLADLGVAPDQPFLSTGTASASHVQPLSSWTTVATDGAFGEWKANAELVDLKLSYPCSHYELSWVTSVSELSLDPDSVWTVVEDSSFLVGSKAGALYRVYDRDDLRFEEMSRAVPARALTKIGNEYIAILTMTSTEPGSVEVRSGPQPNALEIVETTTTLPLSKLRIHAERNEAGLFLQVASRRGLDAFENGSWGPLKEFCSATCTTMLGELFLVATPETGFLPAAGGAGCIGTMESSIQLPNGLVVAGQACPVITGLYPDAEWGLLASIGSNLYSWNRGWVGRGALPGPSPVASNSESVVFVEQGRPGESFRRGPTCTGEAVPNPEHTQSVLRVGSTIFVITDSAGIRIERWVQNRPLNTCSG